MGESLRSRRACRARTLACRAAALCGLGFSPARAHAQFSIASVQPLAFGYLTQGVTEIVPYTDTFRRGVVHVDGAGQAWIRVVLPTTLTSPQGTTIPLQFLTGDLALQESGKAAAAFDPAASTRVNLTNGTASLFIGGRAVPAATQRAGLYSATVTIMVSSTNF
jgi:hypothetical protein